MLEDLLASRIVLSNDTYFVPKRRQTSEKAVVSRIESHGDTTVVVGVEIETHLSRRIKRMNVIGYS